MLFSSANNRTSKMSCPYFLVMVGLLCLTFTTNVVAVIEDDTKTTTKTTTTTCADNSTNAVTHDEEEEDAIVRDMIDWIRKSEDGFVSPKMKVFRPEGSVVRGIYAMEDIRKGETIITIPWDKMIKDDYVTRSTKEGNKEWIRFLHDIDHPSLENDDDDEEEYENEIFYDFCKSVYNLYHDMKEDRTPYARYLKEQPRRYLPHLWSTEGQALFSKMIGRRMPPQDIFDRNNYCFFLPKSHELWQDELWVHADMILRARGDDAYLVPLYDMFNHRNGRYYNVHHRVEDEEEYELIANRDIQKGEEMYNSYNLCNRCTSRGHTFDTIDMFSNYGFVEDYPRQFMIAPVRMNFKIVEENEVYVKMNDASSFTTKTKKLKVKFAVPPSVWGLIYLEEEIKRLEQFKLDYVDEGSVKQMELDSIWAFYDATLEAYKLALEEGEKISSDYVWEDCEGDEWEEVEDYTRKGC